MLKAIVSYSKKVPVVGQEYSSQGYSLSIETEVAETGPAEINLKLSDTFQLVKSQVEHELANGNAKHTGTVNPGSNAIPLPTATMNNGRGKATNRQIKFITDLANQQGLPLNELNGKIRNRFGLEGLYDLNKQQASSVLDLMKAA